MSEGGEHVQVMSTPICLTISYVIALWYSLYIEERGKPNNLETIWEQENQRP